MFKTMNTIYNITQFLLIIMNSENGDTLGCLNHVYSTYITYISRVTYTYVVLRDL